MSNIHQKFSHARKKPTPPPPFQKARGAVLKRLAFKTPEGWERPSVLT